MHIGQCNNCHNITCPFNGKCQSEQGNYTCICPSRNTCSPVRVSLVFSYTDDAKTVNCSLSVSVRYLSLSCLFRVMIRIQSVPVINNYFLVNVR